MSIIYRREVRSYFTTMTGYVFTALLMLVAGIFTYAICFKSAYPNFEFVLDSLSFVFLALIPLITMKSIAEEKHRKTDQLLLSLPLKISDIVIGKYLSMLTVYAIPMLLMCFLPLIISLYGKVNLLTAYTSIIGYFLLGAALIAIGLFISSMTDLQANAAAISFVTVLLIYFMASLSALLPAGAIYSLAALAILIIALAAVIYLMTKNYVAAFITGGVLEAVLATLYLVKNTLFENLFPTIINQLSLFERFRDFINGIFSLTAVVYYLSIIAVFVFLSIQSLEKKRWS